LVHSTKQYSATNNPVHTKAQPWYIGESRSYTFVNVATAKLAALFRARRATGLMAQRVAVSSVAKLWVFHGRRLAADNIEFDTQRLKRLVLRMWLPYA